MLFHLYTNGNPDRTLLTLLKIQPIGVTTNITSENCLLCSEKFILELKGDPPGSLRVPSMVGQRFLNYISIIIIEYISEQVRVLVSSIISETILPKALACSIVMWLDLRQDKLKLDCVSERNFKMLFNIVYVKLQFKGNQYFLLLSYRLCVFEHVSTIGALQFN